MGGGGKRKRLKIRAKANELENKYSTEMTTKAKRGRFGKSVIQINKHLQRVV